jgi:hypothetical protein
VEFDKPLAVAAPLTAASFTLKAGPDSTPVAITLAEPARDAEARAAREREAESRRDTTTRADSLDRVRRADSLRVANQAVRPVPPNVRPPAAPTAPAGKAGAPGTARDTIRGPRPSRSAPDIAYELRLGAPLAAGTTYRLAVTGARNLLGFTGSADRAFTTPRPAPPDTARAARDSTGMLRPPADRVPPGTPARTPAGTPRKPGVKVPPPRPPASPAARPR